MQMPLSGASKRLGRATAARRYPPPRGRRSAIPPRKVEGAQRIIEAATLLFEQKGYHGTTLDDIARRAGMAKPTVYQHVGSKGELLESIFARVLDRMDANFARLEVIDDHLVQLTSFVRHYVVSVIELQPYYRIFFGEERELPVRTRRRFREWSHQMTDRMVKLLEQAQADGILRGNLDARLTLYLLVGMLSSVSRWYRPGEWSADRIVEEIGVILGDVVTPEHREAVAALFHAQA